MKRRPVEFHEEATRDLLALYDWTANAASRGIALSYLERLEAYCLAFDLASERGHLREDIRPGLRIAGFEKRVTIAFVVQERASRDLAPLLRWPELGGQLRLMRGRQVYVLSHQTNLSFG